MGLCLSMTLLIVDLWQYYLCTLYKIWCNPMHHLHGALLAYLCASAGYTWCSGRTSVYSYASSLQNLAIPHDLYFPLSVPVGRSCWPYIRWCGTVGYQMKGQCFIIGLSCSILFVLFYFSLSLLSVYRLELWGWGLWIGLLSPSLALPTSFNNNNSNNTHMLIMVTKHVNSWLDHIAMSDVLSVSTLDCRTLHDVACSDHCTITVTLNFNQLPMTHSIERQKMKAHKLEIWRCWMQTSNRSVVG